jgi:hypothetical protein
LQREQIATYAIIQNIVSRNVQIIRFSHSCHNTHRLAQNMRMLRSAVVAHEPGSQHTDRCIVSGHLLHSFVALIVLAELNVPGLDSFDQLIDCWPLLRLVLPAVLDDRSQTSWTSAGQSEDEFAILDILELGWVQIEWLRNSLVALHIRDSFPHHHTELPDIRGKSEGVQV